ncbi:MAG: haloacid dehalogenase, partial [Planctomyces sp.]|nr:haloacid dehalogenase [Planctomyces sp.]
FPDVAPVFSALAEREIKILLASNFDDRLRTIIAGFPEFQRIEQAVISSEVGWRKPAPEFYESLIHISRLPPDTILMVGDDEQNDVLAACQAGLRALLIQRRPTAISSQPHVIHSLMQVLDHLG